MQIRHGLVVRISGSHPGGPGSIPGVGNLFVMFIDLLLVFDVLPIVASCYKASQWPVL